MSENRIKEKLSCSAKQLQKSVSHIEGFAALHP